jgi:putative flavoprotein involved in K+ transport
MPETYLHIRWPDGNDDVIYSPSTVIRQYFEPDQQLSLVEFEQTCTQALDHASERVYQSYGFACTSAMAERDRIQRTIRALLAASATDDQRVQILTIKS